MVQHEEDMCKWERRKIVTSPSPTHQGSQTWCTESIPGRYCGEGVQVILMVFYTCRSHWFRRAIAMLVCFTKAGIGNWKWGQSPWCRSHRHVSQNPWVFKGASQSSWWCPIWSQQAQGTSFPFWTWDSAGNVFSLLVSSTMICCSFEPNELLSEYWWISMVIALSISSWDKELMGEGDVVCSIFGEGAWRGGNSSLEGVLLVEEVEGEVLQL